MRKRKNTSINTSLVPIFFLPLSLFFVSNQGMYGFQYEKKSGFWQQRGRNGRKYAIVRGDFFTQHGHVCLVIFPNHPLFWPFDHMRQPCRFRSKRSIDFTQWKRQENPRGNVNGRLVWLSQITTRGGGGDLRCNDTLSSPCGMSERTENLSVDADFGMWV